jgi:hypothetical protein
MKLIIFVFAFVLFLAVNAYPNAETEDLDSPFTDDESIEARKHKDTKHYDAKRKNVKNKGCPTTAPPPPPTTVPPPMCQCLTQGDGCDFTDVIKIFQIFKILF